jgi:hypothetical protein
MRRIVSIASAAVSRPHRSSSIGQFPKVEEDLAIRSCKVVYSSIRSSNAFHGNPVTVLIYIMYTKTAGISVESFMLFFKCAQLAK